MNYYDKKKGIKNINNDNYIINYKNGKDDYNFNNYRNIKNAIENDNYSNNDDIELFISDLLNKPVSKEFRGWILPNGGLISEYYDESGRQTHSKLVKLFMSGLEIFNESEYDKLIELYRKYVDVLYQENMSGKFVDVDESFAVNILGWLQVSEFGSKRVIYRGENWQDRLAAPFINQYGFKIVINDQFANIYRQNHLPDRTYSSIKEIISIALERKYQISKRI